MVFYKYVEVHSVEDREYHREAFHWHDLVRMPPPGIAPWPPVPAFPSHSACALSCLSASPPAAPFIRATQGHTRHVIATRTLERIRAKNSPE